MAKVSRNNRAAIECVLGASGSGKTHYVMNELRRKAPKRLLIWDTKGEFAREGYGSNIASLAELVDLVGKAGRAGSFALAYKPPFDDKARKAHFDLLCRLAFEAKSLTLVAEELADVTTASFASAGWRMVSSQGRSEGLSIYGLSQQPASIDKHFFGNASTVRTGRLNFLAHQRAVANALAVPLTEIQALAGFAWIARDMHTGKVTRG